MRIPVRGRREMLRLFDCLWLVVNLLRTVLGAELCGGNVRTKRAKMLYERKEPRLEVQSAK